MNFRDRFVIDDPDLLYLDGNSLGRLPRRTVEVMRDVVENQWGRRLVRGWPEHWLALPTRIGDKIAQIIGANQGEVVACDSTSVNLYKLAHATLAQTKRRKIVTDRANFPSDLYLLQGLAAQFPGVEIVYADDEHPQAIEALLDEETALFTLSHIAFRSGRLHDLKRLTKSAHAVGALTLWDLSHSAGAVPIDLERANADLAVGCTYKYLNGGPGGVAYLYVRTKHQDKLVSPIQGWFGQQNAFAFNDRYTPKEGIERFLAGTPPILSLAALEPGLDLILEAGIDEIRRQSLTLTDLLIAGADEHLKEHGFEILTPRNPVERGSHLTLTHPQAWPINQALIETQRLIPDFRAPNGLRLGVAPLYNSPEEMKEAITRIQRVMTSHLHQNYPTQPGAIT